MTCKLLAAVSTALVLTAALPAAAQVTTPPAGSNQVVPEKDPPLEGRSAAPAGGDLSNQLNHSNGVIAPPNVDSSMQKPTPPTSAGGSIIPPPGGGGAAQPK